MAVTAMLGLIFASVTFGVTLSMIVAERSPDLALRAYPFSATARAVKAALLIAPDMTRRDATTARSLAQAALQFDPTSVMAVRSLGLLDETHGDQAAAARLRAYALYLSRRDALTHLWAIENAVAHDDISTALRHYNEALLTSDAAEHLLLPVLVIASGQEQVRVPLLKMLSARPLWWEAFVRELYTTGNDRMMIVSVYRRFDLGRADADPQRRELAGLGLSRLIALGAYGDAWSLAGGAGPDGVRNGSFDQPITSPPFGWQLADELDLAGAIQPGGSGASGYALFPSASGGRSGDAATQLVVLRPGRYVLSARLGGSFPAGSALVARCHGQTGAVLAGIDLPVRATGARVSTVFTVPTHGCGGTVIAVRAASGDGGGSQAEAGWIDDVSLAREAA